MTLKFFENTLSYPKNNLPSRATKNWSSSILSSEESLNFLKYNVEKLQKYDFVIVGGGIAGLYTAFLILQGLSNLPSQATKNWASSTLRSEESINLSKQNLEDFSQKAKANWSSSTRRHEKTLNKDRPTVIVLEKENILGGRIYTYKDENMNVEAGAGRFHSSHYLLFDLIEKLGLKDKVKPIISNPTYIDSSTGKKYPEEIVNKLIQKVITESKKVFVNVLREQSFISFAKSILSSKEIKYIEYSFGFSTEFYYMNAYDAIILMKTLISHNHEDGGFFYLSGGLSQIIENLRKKIIIMGGKIQTGVCVKNVLSLGSYDKYIIFGKKLGDLSKQSVEKDTFAIACGSKCIFALPKQHLQNIIFQRFTSKNLCLDLPSPNTNNEVTILATAMTSPKMLNLFREPIFNDIFDKIYCGSLCRIYTKFRDGSWFENLSRFTTQNDLRMVIPMNPKEGTMMISYSDNIYADRWNKLYKTSGMRTMKKRLRQLLSECLLFEVPPLGPTQIFYWECGVGYWSVGANSKKISKKIAKPFLNENIFVCGEHYSAKHQQWMEGALQTGMQVVSFFSTSYENGVFSTLHS